MLAVGGGPGCPVDSAQFAYLRCARTPLEQPSEARTAAFASATSLRRRAVSALHEIARRPGGARLAPLGHAVPVLDAERARRLLGEGVAVALAVGGANERGDDLEIPLRDVGGLAPEIGQAKVDVELEEIDAGGPSGHAVEGTEAVGRSSRATRP
jgi:hypothetical protein